jgi:GH25 family lysozyme M1 (1,4-beta-N-acetylmuramidase)
MVDELRALKQNVGIYSSHYEWVSLLGNDTYCSDFTDIPLWYAHFDKDPSFDDYAKYQFGGWKQPMIKQYIDLTRNTVCGFTVDQDYMPDNSMI